MDFDEMMYEFCSINIISLMLHGLKPITKFQYFLYGSIFLP